MNPLKDRSVLYSALAGFLYGLFCRLSFSFKWAQNVLGVMTIGFLIVMPLAVLRSRVGTSSCDHTL